MLTLEKINMKKKIIKLTTIILLIFFISIFFSYLIVNLDIFTDTTLFNQFDLDSQTELFTMGIPNGNENFGGVASIKCPHCLEQGVEV
jgi:hypothetical protein